MWDLVIHQLYLLWAAWHLQLPKTNMYQAKKSHSKSVTHWEDYLSFLNKLLFLDFPAFQHLSIFFKLLTCFQQQLISSSSPFIPLPTAVRFATALPVLLQHNVVHPSLLHVFASLHHSCTAKASQPSLHFLSILYFFSTSSKKYCTQISGKTTPDSILLNPPHFLKAAPHFWHHICFCTSLLPIWLLELLEGRIFRVPALHNVGDQSLLLFDLRRPRASPLSLQFPPPPNTL